MNPLPITITPLTTSHPRCRHQGPLHTTWRSRHCHCHRRRRPPSPLLSATATIVTIMGSVVARYCLPPPSSSSLSSTATATQSATVSLPSRPLLLPPCDLPPPLCRRRALSAISIAHGAMLDRHAALTPSGTVVSAAPACAPLLGSGRWAHCASAAVKTVSSPAAGVRPSFASRVAATGRATTTAAWQR